MSVEFFVRAILITSLALLTSACGSEEVEEEGTTGTTSPTPFIATQHELLPLIAGTTITYDDGKNITATKDTTLSDETTTVYAVNYGNMTQFFSSTPEQILLHGVNGTFTIPDIAPATNISFNTIRFSPPILIWKKEQAKFDDQIKAEGTATAKLAASVFGFPVAYDVNATILESSTSQWVADQTLPSAIGQFQSKKIVLAINLGITIPELSSEVFPFLLKDTLNLTPGLGIVSRDVDYTNGYGDDSAPKFTHTISAVSQLPHPITFVKSGASPTPSVPQNTINNTYDQDAIFNLSNGADISSEQYDITNMEDINTAGWINITKDDTNKNYMVEILVNENTPVSSTSLLVMFEHKTSGEELPANINLIANP
ncbi:MAG: hypothetical protein JKY54_13690 [Flavobacteriales bacterium]|nr:hypothetical protein [Flavobacteriales bacterium]